MATPATPTASASRSTSANNFTFTDTKLAEDTLTVREQLVLNADEFLNIMDKVRVKVGNIYTK